MENYIAIFNDKENNEGRVDRNRGKKGDRQRRIGSGRKKK